MGKGILLLSIFVLSFNSHAVVGFDTEPLDKNHPVNTSTVALVKKTLGRYKVFCSGSLVAKSHVYTAKHCLEATENDETFIYFGSDVGSIDSKLIRPIINRNVYKKDIDLEKSFPAFDFAFVEFAGDIPNSNGKNIYKPVKIFNEAEKITGQEEIMLSGFGVYEVNPQFKFGVKKWLKTSNHEFVSTNQFKNLILITTGANKGSCHGDSGGPVYIKWNGEWLLYGVASGFDVGLTPSSYKVVDIKDNEMAPTCSGGQSIYNYAGEYSHWVMANSDAQINFSNNTKQPEDISPIAHPDQVMPFSWWCENSTAGDDYWYTVRQLLYFASDSVDNSLKKDTLVDCQLAETILNEFSKIKFIEDDFFADLSPLVGLASLEKIEFVETAQPDVSPLINSKATHVKFQNLKITSLEYVESLIGMENLVSLDLTNNAIEDISLISEFSQLTELKLGRNKIQDIQPLETLKQLKVLELFSNDITDIEPILNLSDLTELLVANNSMVTPQQKANWPLLELGFFNGNQFENFDFIDNKDSIKRFKMHNQKP